MSRFNPRLIGVVLFAVVGYAAFHFMNSDRTDWREFTASDDVKITAFALVSRYDDNYNKNQPWMDAQPKLHRDIILSQKVVQDAKARRELQQSFSRIVSHNMGEAACVHEYRHALRFEKDGRTVDAMICFSCGHMEVFDSAGKTSTVDFWPEPPAERDKFDAIFARMGMKQFKPYKKQ